jgi:hypothetical protein
VFVIGTLVLASPVRADHTSLHVTARADVAATDNLFAVGGDQDREADAFITVRPGLLYAYDAPRMIHELTVEAEAIEYVLHSDQPSLSGRGGWRALLLPGPRSQVDMSIDAGTGVLTSLSSRASSDETSAMVTPGGKIDVQQANVLESLSWISSEHTRVSQEVFGRYTFTDDGAGSQTDTREVGGNLGFERTFHRDTIVLGAAVSYLRLERVAPASAAMGSRTDRQLNPRTTVAWHHDIDQRWSVSADAGLALVNPVGPVGTDKNTPDAPRDTRTFTVFGAGVAYTELWGRAALVARRNVTPNVYLAENTITEDVNLQVAMPLPWLDDTKRNPKLATAGSVGVQRTQVINSDTGSDEGDIAAAHFDLSVRWTPKPNETFGVRYELRYQTSGDAGMPGMPGIPGMTMTPPSYYRNTVFFTFSWRYPDRIAGEVPKRTKRMRSDRQDLAPGDGELVVPDVFDRPYGD